MCGIAGIISKQPSPLAARLSAMHDRLQHRGPDGEGFLQWDGCGDVVVGSAVRDSPNSRVAIAHRRLAILDLSEAAWQPMSSADGRWHIAFNGEIYNYIELRSELQRAGHDFRSTGDTEVLLTALQHWGPAAALPRLVGMFAFALLDTSKRRVFLARDPFGIKPLYYMNEGGQLVFASEIKALFAQGDLPWQVNPHRLFQYLRFGLTDHGAETLVSNIAQVPAASVLDIPLDDPSDMTCTTYWKLEASPQSNLSEEEAGRELQRLFLESVEIHLRSDVPVGAALSGGIDSSAIVMAMRQLGSDQLNLNTISYVAPGSEVDEERYADIAGRAAAARIIKTSATTEDLVADVEALIAAQDEPFGSTSIFAQWRVFQAARDAGIKVMLDGQGADEMLGGYRYFFAARVASLIRHGQLLQAQRLLRSVGPNTGHSATPPVWMHAAGMLLPPFLRGPAMQISGHAAMPAWLNSDWFQQHDVLPLPPQHARGVNYLNEQLRLSICETSLPALLRYEDRNSMASSIESRVPFLTPQLAEFILSLPESYIVSSAGVSKSIFRRAMRGLVPDVILDRKDKIGFATPEAEWLQSLGDWVGQVLNSDVAAQIPAIRVDMMRRDWQDFLEGRARFDFRFWRWINLIRWADMRNIRFD